MVEKMQAFVALNDSILRPYGCNDTNYTAAVNCANSKTETLTEIIELQIIGIQTNFVFLF